jgi:hypothetical protein
MALRQRGFFYAGCSDFLALRPMSEGAPFRRIGYGYVEK